LLHGTGGDENDLIPIAAEISPGSPILSPRGKVLENGMPRFFRRLDEGVFDLEDLIFRTNELADFVKLASSQYGFDPNSVVAIGYSNGANIAASLLLLRPESLRGAVLFRPVVPLTPAEQPNLSGKQVYVSAGLTDHIVPRLETEKLVDMLRVHGADVILIWARSGHALVPREVQDTKEWFARAYRG
jgi:predicted esterase